MAGEFQAQGYAVACVCVSVCVCRHVCVVHAKVVFVHTGDTCLQTWSEGCAVRAGRCVYVCVHVGLCVCVCERIPPCGELEGPCKAHALPLREIRVISGT